MSGSINDDGFGHTVSGEPERRERRTPVRRGPPGTNGPVTLVVRVSGASRLVDKLGAGEAARFLKRCVKRLEQASAAFHGQVVRQGDDGLVALFEDPVAALLGACRMQQGVADLPPVSGVQPAVRIAFDRITEDSQVLPLGESIEAVLALTRQARQSQVVTRCVLATLLPARLQHVVHRRDRPEDREGDDAVCEIRWRELGDFSVGEPELPPVVAGPRQTRLRLRHGGREVHFDPGMPPIVIGRDAECDIVVTDRRGSRKHARIEWRNNRFVLTDISLNGTYVGVRGMARILLKRDDAVLHGSGVLVCGHNDGKKDEETVAFEVDD